MVRIGTLGQFHDGVEVGRSAKDGERRIAKIGSKIKQAAGDGRYQPEPIGAGDLHKEIFRHGVDLGEQG
jgi:hypothetical protein